MRFWIPKYKDELVKWLKARHPHIKWEYKSKKQLYAVYFGIRGNE